MKTNLKWLALIAVLALPAALAWAGQEQAAPAGAECCCCQESCPKD